MNRWNERYAGEDFLFGTAPNAFLRAQRDRLPAHGTALAVADGEGRNGVWLAAQGLDVLAVDASEVGLAKSRHLAGQQGVALHWELADLAQWDFGRERFDVVVAIFIQFADPALRARIFAGIQACLKPGGLLLLEGYRPEQLGYRTGGPSEPDHLYTEAMLRDSFARLEIEHLASYDAELDEGTGHRGMSALIDLVARKPASVGG